VCLATGAAVLIVLAGTGGCATPLHPDSEPELRRSILGAIKRDTEGSTVRPPGVDPSYRPTSSPERVKSLGLPPDIQQKLEQTSGMGSYKDFKPALGPTLNGEEQGVAPISLQRVVLTTASNNLTLEFARLVPAINQAHTIQAQSVFDWVLFASAQDQYQDNATQRTSFGTGPLLTKEEQRTGTIGLRRKLETGGSFTIQNQLSNLNNYSPGTLPKPNPAVQPSITVQLDQPLMRNFGTDANLAEVRQAINAERDSVQQLKATLLQQIADAETAYWTLVRAQGELNIAQRLLDRGEEVRGTLSKRREKAEDVRSSQFSDAVATVESRRSDVLRAQNTLRQASDKLKQIMNDPDLSIGSEVLLQPIDNPVSEPLALTLQDVVTTALANRPEVQRALIAINDASIRQQLADNARLPALDIRLQTRVSEIGSNISGPYSHLTDANFIDYLVGVSYEQPIGNRNGEAGYRQRFLESAQARTTYRDVVQRVLVDVKTGLRQVVTTYQLIEQTHASRIASAENLRTLEVEERTIQALTPEFLDLKLRRQQALASAEAAELAAFTEYNASIARLYAAMGTALERNRILFAVPKATDPLPGEEQH
jgi:outer membrane protein TolC